MKREERIIQEIADETALKVTGLVGYERIIRAIRKGLREAYKAGQESVQVPEQPKPRVVLETADPIRKEFVQFLRDQRILKRFLESYEEYNKKPFNINEYLNVRGEEWTDGAIYSCFLWRDTPEGVDFWSKIASGWQDRLEQLEQVDRLTKSY